MRKFTGIDNGQMTLSGKKLIDNARFTKTELIKFSATKAADLTEMQLVTRCGFIQEGVCHFNSKRNICEGLCPEWFTYNIPLIIKLSNKVSDQLSGVGIAVAMERIEWVHSFMLKNCMMHVSLST